MNRLAQIERSLDAEWFTELRHLAPPLLIASYQIESDVYQKLFTNFIETRQNPVITYRLPSVQKLLASREALTLLRTKIIQKEPDKAIRDAYSAKIDVYLAEVAILLASAQHDWSEFTALNNARFGNLDAREVLAVRRHLQRRYGLLSTLPLAPVTVSRTIDVKVFAAARAQLAHLTVPAFADDALYDAPNIVSLWNSVVTTQYPPWQAKISARAFNIRVSNRTSRVYVPTHARIVGRQLRALFAHEVLVHVARREAGKRSQLQLLSIGTAHYVATEEGLGLLFEQLALQHPWYAGLDRYVALAYALGDLDGTPHDFAETFSFLEQYLGRRLASTVAPLERERVTQKLAWRLCMKIFRGGNPALPGCCLRKEKLYREGNRQVWKLLAQQPAQFALWPRGKFDITSEADVALIERFAQA